MSSSSLKSIPLFFLLMVSMISGSLSEEKKVPRVEVPAIKGEKYQAVVPDTLDLTWHGELALQAITNGVLPKLDYEPAYSKGRGTGEFFLGVKWLEALPMLRTMTGRGINIDVEEKMMSSYLSHIADDGLLYCPANTPARQGGRGYEKTTEPYTSTYADGRMILAMMAWYQRDNDPKWLERIQKMARGLEKVAFMKDDYAYYPDGGVAFDFSYLKESGYKNTEEPGGEHSGAEGTVKFYQSNQPRSLARWYIMSGDEDALDLAGKVIRFIMKPKFWEEGVPKDIVGYQRGQWSGHYHGNSATLMAILRYAVATNDWKLKQFVRNSYEFSRNLGVARIGWFPTYAGDHSQLDHVCETCRTADMISLAIELSDQGIGDYWDDVDGYIRNTLIEQQYTDSELLQKLLNDESANLDMWRGAFCCGGLASLDNYLIGCCTGNGSIALYQAWEGIVRYSDGFAKINLLLNRASKALDINSYLPYEGKVVIHNKKARKIAVRIPGWVDRSKIVCMVGKNPVEPVWFDNHLLFEKMRKGQKIKIEFPMVEEKYEWVVAYPVTQPGNFWPGGDGDWEFPPRETFTFHFKGNTLIDITPRKKGSEYVIYQRQEYLKDRAPMKTVTRFAPEGIIGW